MASKKDKLVVLDFDGFLLDSYALLKSVFAEFGLNIGDVERFQNRRKFLKYLGGGKEFLSNLVFYSLPKKKKIRDKLTEIYREEGRIFREFVPVINQLISDPSIHVGILSRNYTLKPGETIRIVLENSDIEDHSLDFVIPIPTGVKKNDVLEGMKSFKFNHSCFCGDEIGDYNAALATGYDIILMASYGFDNKKRLMGKGRIPEELIHDTPGAIANRLRYLHTVEARLSNEREKQAAKSPAATSVLQ